MAQTPPSILRKHLPVFVLCEDGKFYENLVYGDDPRRRAWFLCFDPEEPAEIVVRESEFAGGSFHPSEILDHRGFGKVWARLFNARKSSHLRYFGPDEMGRPAEPVPAISWFVRWNARMRFPVPCKYDECAEVYPVHPGKPGVYFGV